MKVLRIMLPAFFFMSLAFGADKFVDLPEGDHYVPSRLSYQGLAQMIGDGLGFVEDVNIALVERITSRPGFVTRLFMRDGTLAAFRVFFIASPGLNLDNEIRVSCELKIIYKDIASEGYYLATKGKIHACWLYSNEFSMSKLESYLDGSTAVMPATAFPWIATTSFPWDMEFELGPEQLAELM